jgi:hypothetical protein
VRARDTRSSCLLAQDEHRGRTRRRITKADPAVSRAGTVAQPQLYRASQRCRVSERIALRHVEVERDPERGRAAAAKLKALGVKGILIKAAERGYITQLACKMPECFCPEELGGACYFEPVTPELSDWMPTHEHFPLSKREGGKVAVDNAILAHRLCNRIDYSISVGRSYASDLKRTRKAREDAIRRNEGPDASARL